MYDFYESKSYLKGLLFFADGSQFGSKLRRDEEFERIHPRNLISRQRRTRFESSENLKCAAKKFRKMKFI